MSKNPSIAQAIDAGVTPTKLFTPARSLLLAVLAIAALFPWFVDSPAHQNVAILILMAAQMGVAWNIVGGYAGQVSLGHVAFYGLGAYTSTLLFTQLGVNPWLAMLAGGVVAAAISLLI
ncbi:MAG: ABC transporter permease subunit, partial [Noviherbaspirillum sp.]